MLLEIAFKEWAVVCRALAEGRQSLILRKGGIAEVGGEFRPDHQRFWLYPTFMHEHRDGIKPEFLPTFKAAISDRPQRGKVKLSHVAEVTAVFHSDDWQTIQRLDDMHIWSEAAVRAKFDYRAPGLFVLAARILALTAPVEIAETEAYAGCKTWVQLDAGEAFDKASPVLDDAKYVAVADRLTQRLN